MGINKMKGIPWHIETLKTDDERRHKNWCIHFDDGKCNLYEIKCSGSKNCEKYKSKEEHETKNTISKGNYVSYNYYDKKYLQGRFTLEFEDGTRQLFIIGKDIDINAPIMDSIIKAKYRDEFEYNGEIIKVVMKKIRYSREAVKMQNYHYNKILSDKSLDEECENNTNFASLKFKLQFLSDGKVIHYRAGSTIRWDDPLIEKIIEIKNGTKFTYKSIELMLINKYVHEKTNITDRTLNQIINFVRRYLLKNYNHFIIDVNDEFIGCKFYKGEYYIFSISTYENKTILTYRMDFTEKEVIDLMIDDMDNPSLAVFINQVMDAAINKNETLINKMKILPHSLVNYHYGENETTTNQNENEECTNQIESKELKTVECELLDDENEKFNEYEIIEIENEDLNNEISEEELSLSLNNINMSNRLRNCMMNNNITTLRDFLKLDLEKIKNIKSLGRKSANEAAYLIVALKNDVRPYILEKGVISTYSGLEDDIKISDKLIENLYEKISIDECDFSARLYNCLKTNNILTIGKLINTPNDSIKKFENLGKKSYEEALEFKRKIKNEINFGDNNEDFLIKVIKLLSKEKEVSYITLRNFLMNYSNYPVDMLMNEINELRNKKIIVYKMNGMKIKNKSIIDYINELDEEKKELIIERFQGKTLQEMGRSRGVTRERIRQKIVKIIENIPLVEEDKYKNIFEDYDISESDFVNIFEEEKIVYNYLKEKYKNGDKDIKEALNDVRINESQREKIRRIRRIIKLFGETIEISKSNIIRALTKQYARKSFAFEDFANIYNDFIQKHPEWNLDKSDDRTIEGILSRTGETVFTLGRKFRYYDYNAISEDDYNRLKEIFMTLDAGYYSTLVIYNNNKELISSLDIKDEYELHNLSKSLFSDLNDLTFDRMPNFSIKGVTKDEFLEEKIKELAPISLSDFGEVMESEYGHKSATVTWYVGNNYFECIENGILKNDIELLANEDVEKIKRLLTKPIYSLEEMKDLLKNNGYANYKEILISANMYKIGYRIRSSYICSKEITSIEEYFRDIAEKNDFIENDNILRNSTYSSMMKRIEKTLDIFLISNNEYITIKKLRTLGINKEDIINFCEKVKEKFEENSYFTLSNVRDLIEIEKLDDFGFDDIFLENIIGNIENISCLKFSKNKIFSFNTNEIESKKFILDCIGNKESIFIDELQKEILDNYGIEIDSYKIKNAIMDTDLYISDMLNKIYQNKNIYYEEVYQNE